jgi:hypothetical protein
MSNSVKTFKKTSFSDKDLSKLQNNIDIVLKPITNCPIIDGVLVENVSLNASITNEVFHKLGRKPLGFIIVRKSAESDIWDDQNSNKTSDRTFFLKCSNNVTVNIWFF